MDESKHSKRTIYSYITKQELVLRPWIEAQRAKRKGEKKSFAPSKVSAKHMSLWRRQEKAQTNPKKTPRIKQKMNAYGQGVCLILSAPTTSRLHNINIIAVRKYRKIRNIDKTRRSKD